MPALSPLTEDFDSMLRASEKLGGGLGAVAWAVLEMMRRGGASQMELSTLQATMAKTFTLPTDGQCNMVLRVLAERLERDRIRPLGPGPARWY